MDNHNQQLTNHIQKLIHDRQITMRPRAYFVASAVLFGAGLCMAITLAVLYIGTIVFRLRVHSPFLFLQAGQKGFAAFLSTFPWFAFLCAGIAIVASILIMRRYDFSYRRAFPAMLIGFCGVLIVLGVTADILNLASQANRVGIIQTITGTDYDTDTWIIGSVVSPTDNDFILQTPDGSSYHVIVTPKTSFRPPETMAQGEWAQVLGERNDGSFVADICIHRPAPHGTPPIQPLPNNGPN